MPCPMHDNGRIGPEAPPSIIWIAEPHRAGRHLDMKNRPRLDARVEFDGADAGQAAANAPRTKRIASLGRARIPALAHPDQMAPIPRGEVDEPGIDTVDQQFASAGEALMAVDDGEKKLHADTVALFHAGSSLEAGTGVLLRNVLVV